MITNASTKPLIRAGRSNMVWPIFGIVTLMFANIMILPIIARIVVGMFLSITLIIGIRMYLATLARIVFMDDRVEMLLALTRREISYDKIKVVKIVRLRLTPLLRIRISPNNAMRAIQFSVPGPTTPWGSLEECGVRIRDEFRAKGVPVQ